MRRTLFATAAAVFAAAVLVPATASTAAPHRNPQWKPCPSGPGSRLQCATLRVPVDYRHPDGATLTLAVDRLPATDTAHRRGILVLNTGGPGEPGLQLPELIGATQPAAVTARYDLVGFDPRYVGRSTPMTCGLDADAGTWPHWPVQDGFGAEARRAHAFATACQRRDAAVLPQLTTRNQARDMDAIRDALGAPALNYLGYSYGSYLGAVYQRMFPDRTGALVLDSVVDPDGNGAPLWRGWGPGFEGALTTFATRAAARDATYHLGATPTAVRSGFDRLLSDVDAHPRPVTGGGTMTGEDLRQHTFQLLYQQTRFSYLATGLSTLERGRPLPNPGGAGDTGVPADNSGAVFVAQLCQEGRWSHDPASYLPGFVADSARYPFAGPMSGDITPCAFWTSRAAEPVTDLRGSHRPALLVQADHDPATPPAGATAMARYLPGSRILGVPATQHVVYPLLGNGCVNNAVAGYLLTGTLPATDLRCPAGG